ncbi:MAG: glycoside hydrolase family 16 protein [Micrococcales bacterium]|nr:glycoside hydrolase family 16 protein [Micrococcales bacterium]
MAGFGSTMQAQAVTMPTATISFPALTKVTYGNPDIALNITQSAGVTTATSVTPTICSVLNNSTIKILTSGVCKITATNPGAVTHKPARAVTRSFTISKAVNTVTLSDFGWLSMANPTADLTATETSGTTTLTSLTTKYCTLSGNKVTAIKVGTCTIRASNPGNSNYLPAKSVSKSVKIGLTSTVAPPVVPPVTPPVSYAGPWTIRQSNFNDTNSTNMIGDSTAWVNNGWYRAGLRFQIAQVEVKSTTRLSYTVTDGLGRPTPNKTVYLSVGKRHGGSNAKVQVGTQSTTGVDRSPLDQLLLTGTTDAQGVVNWDITGLDTTARSGLFVQVAAWVSDLGVDTIDITNLEYSIPAGGAPTGGGNTSPPIEKTLIWSDEFNGAAGSAPNSANWTPDLGDGCNNPAGCGWGNNEAQAYAACANKQDGNGSMLITASTSAGDATCTSNKTWTSGKFTSYGKKHFTYGYFEARLKMPAGGGTWPAFWTLGSNINTVSWPSCGELDIMEFAGNNPTVSTSAAHYKDVNGNHDYKMGALNSNVGLSQAYHNYGMLWTPTEVTMYIDDRQVFNVKKGDTGLTNWPFGPSAQGVDPKMYVIFNLAMGGSYGGGIANNFNKATFSIDYFRYYSANGYGSTPTNN